MSILLFLLVLVGPLLWAIGNHIDTFLISKYFQEKSVGTLLIFSSVIGVIMLPFLIVLKPNVFDISFINAVYLLVDGILAVLVMWLYFKALESNTASSVVPMYQIAPIFAYIFSYFILGESLGIIQIFAMFVIICGAIILSFEENENKIFRINYVSVLFMLLAVIVVGFQSVLFKFVILEEDFWLSSFWYYVGLTLVGCSLLLFHKRYRKEFIESVRSNSRAILCLNILNEILTIVGTIAFTYTYLYVPVSTTMLIGSYQSVFVLLIGLVLSRFVPSVTKEKFTRKIIFQKSCAIIVMAVGTYLLLV